MTKKTVVLGTNNKNKVVEINAMLNGWQVRPQSDFDVSEAEETGLSFVENAILKARHACIHSGLPAIADDSGLEVDALNGQPGIYSARYAGDNASDRDNLEKLLKNMRDVDHRSARFRCVIVYMRHQHDPSPIICNGTWEGEITESPKGSHGFGYDPIFFIPELGKTAAEMDAAEKNRLSHRGSALVQLRNQLI